MSQLIHTSTAPAVEVLPFHKDAAAILGAGQRAGETMDKKMRALLVSRYGSPTLQPESEKFGEPGAAGGPTFEQYTADQKALKLCCKTEGAQQYARKGFAKAVRTVYGALPVAQTPEALRKAAERKIAQDAIAKAREGAKAPAGAPAGQTQDRQPTEAEQIESLVTRIGLIKTADAIVRILKADEKTAGHAVHIEKMLAKVAATLAQTA